MALLIEYLSNILIRRNVFLLGVVHEQSTSEISSTAHPKEPEMFFVCGNEIERDQDQHFNITEVWIDYESLGGLFLCDCL